MTRKYKSGGKTILKNGRRFLFYFLMYYAGEFYPTGDMLEGEVVEISPSRHHFKLKYADGEWVRFRWFTIWKIEDEEHIHPRIDIVEILNDATDTAKD